MNTRTTLVVALLAATISLLPAQTYEPVPGGDLLHRLSSPLFLAGTENSAGDESVSGDAFNPAASALKQRIHLDASYAALVGESGYNGHAAFAGTSVPTPGGVFTASLQFANAGYRALDLGTRAALNFSFAKDLYPQLLFGAGLRGELGDAGGGLRGAGGLNLGIIHLLGERGFVPDLRWGLSLTGLGIGLRGPGGTTGSPAPFSLHADVQATLLDAGPVTWKLHTGFSLPSFQNLRLRAGTQARILDRVSLNLGWDLDLREQVDGDRSADSLLPSVGLTLRFQTGRGGGTPAPGTDTGAATGEEAPFWQQSDLAVRGVWAPLYPDVWAAGAGINAALGVIDRNPPDLELTYPETAYLSPNNDGAADELLLPIAITDERFVNSWRLEIADAEGQPVRTIENKELRPENAGFRNIIDRLLFVEQGVDVPRTLRWDGRTDDGTPAPDGLYRFTVRATDDNGNTRESAPAELIVDATAPEVSITIPEEPDALVFSPNDDGNKDVLRLPQDSSEEDLWSLQVLDATDRVVYEEQVTGAELGTFTWDGRDAEGLLVPDGVYSYRVASQDRALNETTELVSNIIVDTEPTPIALAADIGHFSPNGDGTRDAVTLTPDVPIRDGIREVSLSIRNEEGSAVRSVQFGTGVPPDWSFDGRDDGGTRLPEGRYGAELVVLYRNGNRPAASSPQLTLDLTPPRLAVRADSDIFSPNGDGRLDTVAFLHETERVEDWRAEIRSEDGTVVRTFRWDGTPAARLVWEGRDDNSQRIPDGTYRYVLQGTDRAGNVRRSPEIPVMLDTRETPVFIAASRGAFSPNGDGAGDTLDLLPQLADPRGVERFEMRLLNTDDQVVARISNDGVPEPSYTWDGRGAGGSVVADGDYRIELEVVYRHGNRPRATSQLIAVDTRAPQLRLAASDEIFSPDGDGDKDRITFQQSSSDEERWEAAIVDAAGRSRRTWQFSGELDELAWDGTDDTGEVLPDGTYRYRVVGVDAGGNRSEAQTSPFRIDTREVDVRLRVSEAAFSPNGDGTLDTVDLEPVVSIDTPIRAWTLAILPAEGETPVWERSGGSRLQPVTWDGRSSTGGRVPDGEFRARLSVDFARGDSADAIAPRSVLLDTRAPQAELALSSDIISPNGDGRLDQLVIRQETTREQRWTARILTEDGREVGRWEWAGTAPAELAFRGLDTARQRVADGIYRYQLSATDEAGNRSAVSPQSFEIYTAETPLDLYPASAAFSPNDDGVQDEVAFPVRIGPARGLQSYRIELRNEAGEPVRTESGSTPPETYVWDGREDNGEAAAEGAYRAVMVLEYRHGNRPEARTEPVVLDRTAPALRLTTRHTVFSPDGDGRRDTLQLSQSSDPAREWAARLTGPDGETIRSWSWSGEIADLDWDGTDAAGNTVDDGSYRYTVSGVDEAGNRSSAGIESIRVDTRPTTMFLTVDRRTISPNGDGQDDRLGITTIVRRTDGAEQAVLEVLDSSGVVLRQLGDTGMPEARSEAVWDGTLPEGTAPDGSYSIRYRVTYDNGALGEAVSPLISVDTRGPELAVDLRGLPFSPDNDGLNDELGIGLTVDDAGDIESWTFEILDRNRRPFQDFTGRGVPRDQILWDGRGQDGELVISAEDYPYRFTAEDSTGNRSVIEGRIPIDILVVRDGDQLRIQISNINFAPNSPSLELDGSTDQGASNLAVLDRLVEVFDKYSRYRIEVEGHAVNLTGTEREEREELQPLSEARARTVREALVDRGMEPERISIEGRGGLDPVVPHTDQENRWKNRRVEFILIR